MRPPLSAIEPLTDGVSIATRGDAARAASRVGATAGTEGAPVPGAAGAAASGVAPGDGMASVGAGGACSRCGCGVPTSICQPNRTAMDRMIAISKFF